MAVAVKMASENSNKKILIISFAFPPANTVGAIRTGKLAKYLSEYGWDPYVIAGYDIAWWPQTLPVEIDESRVTRIPFGGTGHFVLRSSAVYKNSDEGTTNSQKKHMVLQLIRIKDKIINSCKAMSSVPIIRSIFSPYNTWRKTGIDKCMQLINIKGIDLIFSTYDPPVCHYIASQLQRQTGIPWIAEFRDLWSQCHYSKTNKLFRWLIKCKEIRTMKNAAVLVTVSEPLASKLSGLHKKRVVTITNGFDQEDYQQDIPCLSKFTITYTGTIIPSNQDPSPLFQAIAELRNEDKLPKCGLEVRFFGKNIPEIIGPLIREYQLEQFVSAHDLEPFKQSVLLRKESTILLLLLWNENNEKGIYTSKVFEYLGSRKPVLGIGFKGSVVDELLERTGSGVTVQEVYEVKKLLSMWFAEFQQFGSITTHYSPNNEMITQYSRKETTKKFAQLFNEVVSNRGEREEQ